MNIIKSTENLSPALMYALVKSPIIKKMRSAEGATLQVSEFVLYEDFNTDGEIKKVVSLRTVDGDVFATNSPTFCSDFETIVEIFPIDSLPPIDVLGMQSKKGRHFITCAAHI